MIKLVDLLSVQSPYTWEAVLGIIIAFGVGFSLKSAIVIKQRKRILRLEDEMLSNHAHILHLEKKVSEGRVNGIVHNDHEFTQTATERKVKIS